MNVCHLSVVYFIGLGCGLGICGKIVWAVACLIVALILAFTTTSPESWGLKP